MDEVEANHRLQDALTYQLLAYGVDALRQSATEAPAFNVRKLKAFRDHVTRNLAPTVARGFAEAGSMLAHAAANSIAAASASYQQPQPSHLAHEWRTSAPGVDLSSQRFCLTSSSGGLSAAAEPPLEASDVESPAPWLDPTDSNGPSSTNVVATGFAAQPLAADLSDDIMTHQQVPKAQPAAAETKPLDHNPSISTDVIWIDADPSVATQIATVAATQIATVAAAQQQPHPQPQPLPLPAALAQMDEGEAGGRAAVAQRPSRRRRGSRGGALLEGAGRRGVGGGASAAGAADAGVAGSASVSWI